MTKLLKHSIIAALSLSALSLSAHAGSVNTPLEASATISSSCLISATNVSFGTVTPAATGDVSATGTIKAHCTNGTAYKITISAGSSSDANARKMAGTSGNTDKFAYNLYSDAGYSQVWKATEVDGIAGVGTGAEQSLNVYAKAPLNQYLKPDTYTDSLTVTLAY